MTPPNGADDFFVQMVERVMLGVEHGQIPRFQYGAILIDEGHDFEPDWYKLIVQMVDPSTNSLLILYDDAQNIYGDAERRKTTWKSLGVQAQGRTTVLRLNYRNTLEILFLARSFALELLTERPDDDEGIPLVAPESAGRRGPLPELVRATSAEEERKFLITALADEHTHGRAWHEMAVIYRHHWEGDNVANALKRVGIPYNQVRGRGNRESCANPDAVSLLTMHSSKGLEFPVVALPNLGAQPRADENESDAARLLYVAMTRATEQLFLLHHSESTFTGRIRASINDMQQQLAQSTDSVGISWQGRRVGFSPPCQRRGMRHQTRSRCYARGGPRPTLRDRMSPPTPFHCKRRRIASPHPPDASMKYNRFVALISVLLGVPAFAALETGTQAPMFSARAYLAGEPFLYNLADALHKGPVVLYFFPAAHTPGCNLEAHLFSAAIDDFKAEGATVIGITAGNIDELAAFSSETEHCAGKFPVAADPQARIAKQYNAVLKRKPEWASRTSYLIRPDGSVSAAYSNPNPAEHVAQMLAALREPSADPASP